MIKRSSLAVGLMLLQTAGGICSAQTLRQRAEKIDMLIGTAVNQRLLSEPAYASTLAREFNMVEAENGMKWRATRPSRETFDFAAGDQIVRFAAQHRMKVRGHTLVWSKYNPAWLAKGSFTPAELNTILRDHITRMMDHYEGQVFAWDVVNEAFKDDGSLEPSIWYASPGVGLEGKGTAYIEQAFRWARVADPKALLFYNDYGAEGINAKSDAIYRMVKDFKRRGVPIDGVGMQAHVFDLGTKDLETMPANIERLAALGVQVHITELDVGLPTKADGSPRDPADLTKQADFYRRITAACLRQKRCTALQTWGFTDKYSWIPGYTKGAKGAPLPFDREYAPKPAYRSMLYALSNRPRK